MTTTVVSHKPSSLLSNTCSTPKFVQFGSCEPIECLWILEHFSTAQILEKTHTLRKKKDSCYKKEQLIAIQTLSSTLAKKGRMPTSISLEHVESWQQEKKWITAQKINQLHITLLFSKGEFQEEETQTAYMIMCYAINNEEEPKKSFCYWSCYTKRSLTSLKGLLSLFDVKEIVQFPRDAWIALVQGFLEIRNNEFEMKQETKDDGILNNSMCCNGLHLWRFSIKFQTAQ